jgi:hypothetical protein
MSPTADRPRFLAGCAAAGLVIGGAAAWIGGTSLATFLAPLPMVAGVVPPLSASRRPLDGLAGAMLICLLVAAAWCFVLPPADSDRPGQQHITSLRWLIQATAVLAGWVALLWALTSAMTPRRRLGSALRVAAVTIAAWSWLSFPVWLGPAMGARGWDAAVWLTAVHPLFAMNTAVLELGIWTQQPIAYQLTPFGQDVAYALPATIWPFLFVHAGAVLLLVLGRWFAGLRRRRAALESAAQ